MRIPYLLTYLIIFFCLSLLSFSCTTKDGIDFEEGQGNLYISSQSIDAASIFLDYHDTGLKTPALLENVTAGTHTVHLFKSGYRAIPDSLVKVVRKDQTDTVLFTLQTAASGDLIVDSAPDSVRVFINRLEFGYTPLLVNGLPVGTYTINLIKSNYDPIVDTLTITNGDSLKLFYQLSEDIRRFVLIEHFSNTSCPPCPQSDLIIDGLSRTYGPASLVVLGYHANFPSPADPMYLSGRAANDSRIQYYKPPSIPRAFVDGVAVADPLSESAYRTLIDAQLLQDTLLTIAFSQLNRSDSLLQGRVEFRALSDISAGYHGYVALIEDEIDYDVPPGTNGQTHFEAVLRDFYPDGSGEDVELQAGESVEFRFKFSLAADWGNDLTVIVFVQNLVTREVIQCGWTRYPPF